jgi:tRNA(Ile)-lysidine synthase
MITLLGSIPRSVTVAVSGGVDSMAALSFISSRHQVRAAFYHHGTAASEQAYEFLFEYCARRGIELITDQLTSSRETGISPEEYWRDARYAFLNSIPGTVVTAHNLEDSVETWIWSSLHGTAKLIPYSRNNVIRPFLTTSKRDLISWCERKNVPWCEDVSNRDVRYTRNYIRHQLMPHALRVNPGINKMIKKKLVDRHTKDIYTN